MVTKSKATGAKKKGRVKVGKLKLKKNGKRIVHSPGETDQRRSLPRDRGKLRFTLSLSLSLRA